MTLRQRDFPSGPGFVPAERQFDLHRLEVVLLMHPTHKSFDEILQGLEQHSAGELGLGADLPKASAVILQHPGSDVGDTIARLGRRDVAPFFSFVAQLFMKTRQHIVLEISLLFKIQFEQLSLLGPQTGMDEKLERTCRELLQAADGRTEHRAVNPGGKFWGKGWFRFRWFKMPQSLRN